MFSLFRILYEFANGFNLLYTGDYRLSKDDWINCEPLKDPQRRNGFIRLDAFYFDITFCKRPVESIPTLEQSRALGIRMVKEWLDKDPSHKVLLWCGRYGHEFFLKAIWDELNIKCHVTVAKYRIYSQIDWLADCVTPVARDTRVHACTEKPSGKEDCFYEDGQSVVMKKDGRLVEKLQMSACWLCRPDCKIVRVIRPSTIWFASRNEINAVGYENDRFCRLLYSGHASLSEVETAFSLLRPAFAYPNIASELNKDFVKYLSYFRYFSNLHVFLKCLHPFFTGLEWEKLLPWRQFIVMEEVASG
ncbi:unnamed protein product [Gongylonema pulchrum]|uniref:DRMBL domain-containing protein n=1 Tax=Gongylonema pulchrum TaxID=637853 RepID=A0A183EJ57_9BILA|nr:unnamed protein product [Gongylonema pulchrum]